MWPPPSVTERKQLIANAFDLKPDMDDADAADRLDEMIDSGPEITSNRGLGFLSEMIICLRASLQSAP